MTTPGRNDPCPCGSGKKYKHCCATREANASPIWRLLDQAVSRPVRAAEIRRASALAIDPITPWEVDFVPLTPIENDPSARPIAVLVVAGSYVVHADMVVHPPTEPEPLAAILAAATQAAADTLGVTPPAVCVRYAALADPLAAAIRPIEVRHLPVLSRLEQVAAELMQSLLGNPDAIVPLVSRADSWAAWGLPANIIKELFHVAAEFFNAAPWTWLASDELLSLDFPGGIQWKATVLGNGGDEYGLTIYESADDFESIFMHAQPGASFATMRKTVVSLTFDPLDDLPRPMRREVARAGWEVAAPHAYPTIFVLNTPGMGLSIALVQQFITCLRTVVRFARSCEPVLSSLEHDAHGFQWTEPESGVTVAYDRDAGMADEPPPLWPMPLHLTLAGPSGPNADPHAVLPMIRPDAGSIADLPAALQAGAHHSERILIRFADARCATATSKAQLTRDLDHATLFVDYMIGGQGIALAAVTEYDLRLFLYHWFPSHVRRSRTFATTMRSALRRFFDFLAEHEGIVYPWATPILRDRVAFEARWDSFPGGPPWDEDVQNWRADFYTDLVARMLLPVPTLGDHDIWGPEMGPDEASLHRELHRHWLFWRDEVIRSGVTEPHEVLAALVERQEAWEEQPHAAYDGMSVIEIVRRERADDI